MEQNNKNNLERAKDISVIILCWVVVIFLCYLIINAIRPTVKTIEKTDRETVVRLNEALDGLIRIENNVEALTHPKFVEEKFFEPMQRLESKLGNSASNMEILTERMVSTTEQMQKTLASYEALGLNLENATRPDVVDKKIYAPLNKNSEALSSLLAELRNTSQGFQSFQNELSMSLIPTVRLMGKNMDEMTSSVSRLSQQYQLIGQNLQVFTKPENLNALFSLPDSARYISMPFSKSAAQTDRNRIILRLDSILDEDLRERGFQVELRKKNIILDDFNSFQKVRIDSVSLTPEKGKSLLENWQQVSRDFPDTEFEISDYMLWHFYMAVLYQIQASGVSVTEDLENIILQIPRTDDVGMLIKPEIIRAMKKHPLLKKIKDHVVVKKVYPEVRSSDLFLPLKIPLAPIKYIRKETPLKKWLPR